MRVSIVGVALFHPASCWIVRVCFKVLFHLGVGVNLGKVCITAKSKLAVLEVLAKGAENFTDAIGVGGVEGAEFDRMFHFTFLNLFRYALILKLLFINHTTT